MSNPTMLYKYPGPHEIHGGNFDYIIVDEDDNEKFSEAIDSGWCRTTTEALEGSSGGIKEEAVQKVPTKPAQNKQPK